MATGETPQCLALQKKDNILYETETLHPKSKQKDQSIRETESLLTWIYKPLLQWDLRAAAGNYKSKIMDVFLWFAIILFNIFPVTMDTLGSLPSCNVYSYWLYWTAHTRVTVSAAIYALV